MCVMKISLLFLENYASCKSNETKCNGLNEMKVVYGLLLKIIFVFVFFCHLRNCCTYLSMFWGPSFRCYGADLLSCFL